jgi:hypothetical protein
MQKYDVVHKMTGNIIKQDVGKTYKVPSDEYELRTHRPVEKPAPSGFAPDQQS